MTIIDTLKLARSLQSKGGFTQETAEATAEALNEALNSSGVATKADIAGLKADIAGLSIATKADIDRLAVSSKADIGRLDSRLNLLDGKITIALWAIGINAAATIAMLVKHW
jgi:hypothetical protein